MSDENQLKKMKLKVEGMDCPDCARKIEAALDSLPGRVESEDLIASGELRVSHETDEEAVLEAVESAGYRAQKLDSGREGAGKSGPEQQPVWTSYRGIVTGVGAVLLACGLVLELILPPLNPVLFGLFDVSLSVADLLLVGAVLVSGMPVIRSGYFSYVNLNLDVDLLMGTAIVAATSIGFFHEAATLAVLYSIAELLETYSMNRTRRSLQELMELSPDKASVKGPDGERQVAVESVDPGDVVVVRPGEEIPVDGRVQAGSSAVDQSSITGESVPEDKEEGDEVFAGSINRSGYLEVETSVRAAESTLNKIIQLVREAESDKTPSEQFVEKFAAVYTPVVVLLALFTIAFPPLVLGWDPGVWFVRGLMLIVISCPCAFVISTPVSVTSGVTSAAKNGVLIKGGSHLENTAGVECVIFDKTGTLTTGELEVTDLVTVDGRSREDLLAVAASLEHRSDHPIAEAIVRRARQDGIEPRDVEAFENLEGRGIQGRVGDRKYRVGRPGIIETQTDSGGPLDRDSSLGAEVARLQEEARTIVAVGEGTKLMGIIGIKDRVRSTAQTTVEQLKELGVEQVVMLTGDNEVTARSVSREVGLDEFEFGLLPDEKVAAVEAYEEKFGSTLMVGDGINDAPALAAASVGVAMGAAGSDTAIETADISLMGDDLLRLPYLFRLGRRTRRVIKQNIWSSLAVKLLLAAGTPFGYVTVALAVLVGDMGMSLAVTANAMRLSGVTASRQQ